MKYYNAKILHHMSTYFHNYTISLHIHDFTLYSYKSNNFLISIIPLALIID